ncbi:MAG: antitoxin component YwqK of YwqJK toxin-antitoxin module [Rhodothermales bacterium]|jgi:antitoxin component YwqK of YwqJK toxin-antitoxin module
MFRAEVAVIRRNGMSLLIACLIVGISGCSESHVIHHSDGGLSRGRIRQNSQFRPIKDGLWERVDRHGVVAVRSNFNSGLLHGKSEGWHENGECAYLHHHSNGIPVDKWSWWGRDGSLLKESLFVDGSGTVYKFDEGGSVKSRIPIRDGMWHGTVVDYQTSDGPV